MRLAASWAKSVNGVIWLLWAKCKCCPAATPSASERAVFVRRADLKMGILPLCLKPVTPACALNAIHLSQHLFVPSQFIQIMLSSLCLTHCATKGNLWQAPSSSLLKKCKNVKIQTNFGFHCTLKPTLLPEMLLRTIFLTWTLKFKALGPVKFKTLTFLDYVAWYSDNMQDN